jgi:hypothetical protein
MVVASSQCSHPCLEGTMRDSRMTCRVRDSDWSKVKSGEWSEREELGLGRSLNPFGVAHKQA